MSSEVENCRELGYHPHDKNALNETIEAHCPPAERAMVRETYKAKFRAVWAEAQIAGEPAYRHEGLARCAANSWLRERLNIVQLKGISK
jgi:hypothetical protein